MNGECKYIFDGKDTDGTEWHKCITHNELAPSPDAPCAGYEEVPYGTKFLHLIVWQYDDPDRECEWTHVVTESTYLSSDQERKIIEEFMRDNMEQEPDEYDISDSWSNRIDMVDGYKITVADQKEAK